MVSETISVICLFRCSLPAVPVIVILTKIDSMEEKIRNELFLELLGSGQPASEARIEATSQAASRAAAKLQEDYIRRLEEVPHRPSHIVHLRGRLFSNQAPSVS